MKIKYMKQLKPKLQIRKTVAIPNCSILLRIGKIWITI